MSRGIRVGIDTGGTFTDVVAIDESSGAIVSTKTPSTPADPSEGFMNGVTKVLEQMTATGSDLTTVSHGTTVATNALLQEEFAGLGFVTTRGFRHVLEIARQSVPEGYGNSYFWVKPERIVPLHLVREVSERLAADGEVVRAFDEAAAVGVARWFNARGINSVGVCFVNAYVNPEHERRMRDVLRSEHPECAVSISSDVLREYREYERSVTTLVDAFVKPKVSHYISGIKARLDDFTSSIRDGGVPFYVMKSNGGVMSADEIGEQPITTILSGPAAGVLGAALVAKLAEFDSVLTLDAGGTSTDVSVVHLSEPTMTTEGAVGRFPVKVPMVDVATVGTGGGSIAWVAPDGGLKVGPRSAGADPGPLCYRRGGTEPTTTDAHLALGRIPPALLGGELALDYEAARSGLEALAAELDLGLEACAAGVLEIAAWNQANAIRQVTVRRGLDVRDFAMIAFGGSGPLQACRLVDVLDLDAAVVPPNPGNLSALGLLTVDVRNDYVQTFVRRHNDASPDELGAVFDSLEARATSALSNEGFEESDHVLARSADLRYFGQAFEVRVVAPPGRVDDNFGADVLARFHDEHERLYGYCYRDDPTQTVEWVNLRATGIGPITRPDIRESSPGDGDPERAGSGERDVFFDGAWHPAALYARALLRAGDEVRGPAVVEEYGSTLPLAPGFIGRVDGRSNIVVRRARV
ncbi:MAG TPA: hydantoinase/oxoprolinase family protein [Actinomycetota bacterium]|nr:hydantoinase/oxoprolinase family protein [Actinomycetota bacterium]